MREEPDDKGAGAVHEVNAVEECHEGGAGVRMVLVDSSVSLERVGQA